MQNGEYHIEEPHVLQANEPVAMYGHTVFTPAQVELLNAVASLKSNEEITAFQLAMSEFFAKRADMEMERLWDAGIINEDIMEGWAHEHMRTPYRPQI